MSGHYVVAPLVVAKTENGTLRYVYKGAPLPSDVPEDEVKRLVEEGFVQKGSSSDPKPRDKWTVKELQAYADQHSIDLDGATSKADIAAAIEKAEQAQA